MLRLQSSCRPEKYARATTVMMRPWQRAHFRLHRHPNLGAIDDCESALVNCPGSARVLSSRIHPGRIVHHVRAPGAGTQSGRPLGHNPRLRSGRYSEERHIEPSVHRETLPYPRAR